MSRPPATISVEQAAVLLDIARGSAYRAVATGQIPSVRIGRRILVPVGALADQLSVPIDWLTTRLTDVEV